MLYDSIVEQQKVEYMGNMLWRIACIMSSFGGVKPEFPSFTEVFKKPSKKDNRTADDIIGGLCKRLKKMKNSKKKG